MLPCDYLVIGHATLDLLPNGRYTQGGTVTYAGLAAQRLGRAVGVVTSAAELPALRDQPLALSCRRAPSTTVFQNIHTAAGREQYLRSLALPLGANNVPPGWKKSRVVHLGPLTQEVLTLGSSMPSRMHWWASRLRGGCGGGTSGGWSRLRAGATPGVCYGPLRP